MEDLLKRLVEREEANSNAISQQQMLTEVLRRDVDTILRQNESIREMVQSIQLKQVETTSRISCTAPNLCIDLQKQIQSLANTVQTLVESRAEGRGAGKLAIAIAAPLGAVLGMIGTYLLDFLKVHKP